MRQRWGSTTLCSELCWMWPLKISSSPFRRAVFLRTLLAFRGVSSRAYRRFPLQSIALWRRLSLDWQFFSNGRHDLTMDAAIIGIYLRAFNLFCLLLPWDWSFSFTPRQCTQSVSFFLVGDFDTHWRAGGGNSSLLSLSLLSSHGREREKALNLWRENKRKTRFTFANGDNW